MKILSQSFFEEPRISRVVEWILWFVVLGVLVTIPFKIISEGFTPEDDALRHVAKAISSRPWQEILLMRPEITIDLHAGWHSILSFLHNVFGWDQDALLVFSCSGLAMLFLVAGLPWVRYPELWVAALLTVLPFCIWVPRLMIGRPLLVSAAVVVTLLFLWTRPVKMPLWCRFGISLLLFFADAWIHGSWYLFLLLIVPFFLAGERHASLSLTCCWLAGTLVAGCLSGNPCTYLADQVQHLLFSVTGSLPASYHVDELKPGNESPVAILVITGVIVVRLAFGKPLPDLLRMPAFLMAVICWGLAFKNARVWPDWGMPALLVWIVQIIEPVWTSQLLKTSYRRLATGLMISAFFYLAITSNLHSRWSNLSESTKLDRATFEQAPEWLPAPGGIVYGSNMKVFYDLFYAFPDRDWRYALGFEIGLMCEENLDVYINMRKSRDLRALIPWTERMQPADRLFIYLTSPNPPPLTMLEWRSFGRNWWVGRLPENDSEPSRRRVGARPEQEDGEGNSQKHRVSL